MLKAHIKKILEKNNYTNLIYQTYLYRKIPGYFEWINKFSSADIIEFQHFGNENKGINIYEINYNDETMGFFALWKLMLERIDYAEKYNLVPSVIWGKKTPYWDPFLKENAFENYFEPISSINTESIKSSENVVISRGWRDRTGNFVNNSYLFSEGGLNRYIELHKKYIKIRPDINKNILEELHQIIGIKPTVAVHIRGVEWGNIKNHPVPINIDTYTNLIKNAISKYGFKQIFLATDSNDTLNEMIKRFGEKIVYFKDVARAAVGSHTLAIFDQENSREELHHFRMGYEVLRDMIALSYCEGLIAGYSNISVAAQVWKSAKGEDYEYVHIIKNKVQKKGIDAKTAVKKMKSGRF